MQFEVKMRDGSMYELHASYIEVTTGVLSTYALLGPVPNHPIAILAVFPAELVESVRARTGAAPSPATQDSGVIGDLVLDRRVLDPQDDQVGAATDARGLASRANPLQGGHS